jgi:hypothetical protein
MKSLAQQFRALAPCQKRTVHFILCDYALGKWRDYAASRGRIRYAESACATSHVVDKKLPGDAFESAREGRDRGTVDERYLEPITAMQDFDLEFPDSVRYAYYAVYNLFQKYARLEPIDDWLIVNQALASETDKSKWRPLLEEAIANAMKRVDGGR